MYIITSDFLSDIPIAYLMLRLLEKEKHFLVVISIPAEGRIDCSQSVVYKITVYIGLNVE